MEGDLDVWELDVGRWVESAEGLATVLDETERRRWARFHRAEDRARFVVAHVGWRLILAGYVGTDPSALVFDRRCHHCGATHGKPGLPASGLDFNLAHAGDKVVLGVATAGRVGVDVEVMGGRAESAELANRVLSAAELPDADLIPTWALKEACAKAIGLGLALPFTSFAVTDDGPEPADPALWGTQPWWCRTVDLDARHVVGLAASPPPTRARLLPVGSMTAAGVEPAGTRRIVVSPAPVPQENGTT